MTVIQNMYVPESLCYWASMVKVVMWSRRAHLTKPGWSKPHTHSHPTNLALFGHKITLYRFNQGAHTITGGSNRSRGLSPLAPHFKHCLAWATDIQTRSFLYVVSTKVNSAWKVDWRVRRRHVVSHRVTSLSSLCDYLLCGWVSADQRTLSRVMRSRLDTDWSGPHYDVVNPGNLGLPRILTPFQRPVITLASIIIIIIFLAHQHKACRHWNNGLQRASWWWTCFEMRPHSASVVPWTAAGTRCWTPWHRL